MDDSLLQQLSEADGPVEKAAIAAEFIFSMLSKDAALVARQCSILHWFDEDIVEVFLKEIPSPRSQLNSVYKEIRSLPFVEALPWGLAFNRLTRDGLLARYTLTEPDLLRTAAGLAASVYRIHGEDEKVIAEAIFCSIIAGEVILALELLSEFMEKTVTNRNSEYISGLQEFIREAQQIPFVGPLPDLILRTLYHGKPKPSSMTKPAAHSDPVSTTAYTDPSVQPFQPQKDLALIMDGDLQTLGLQSILKMLALSAKTGTLLITTGKETLSIGLRKGQILALWEEGVNRPDLLTMFCLLSKLDPARTQAVREIAQGNFQIELAVLVEQGWMSPAEMQQRLEFAIIQSISHALRWVHGRFSFRHQMLAFEGKTQPLDVDSVLLEALRQADEWEEMGVVAMTGSTLVRWLPEVSNDVRSLGLSQDHIQVLCLANGEVPLQGMALALMLPEARIARIISRLVELHLIEVVDTAHEAELQSDLTNIIMLAQHRLAQQQQNMTPEDHLLGLITTLSESVNALLIHHGTFAKSLRGRGHLPIPEIVRYLERRFAQPLQLLAKQQYPILETITFANGQLDCREILHLHRLVKGEQLEEFYWEAARGFSSFLRTVFATLLNDEVGNFHTGRQLNTVWKAFLTELDREMQQYQIYRAQQHASQRVPVQPPFQETLAWQEDTVPKWVESLREV